jgi:hypothetical protein
MRRFRNSDAICDLCGDEAAAVVEDYGERRIAACVGCAGRLLRLGARAIASTVRDGEADDEQQWKEFTSLALAYWLAVGRKQGAEIGRLLSWLKTFGGWGDGEEQRDRGVGSPRRDLFDRLYGVMNREESRRQPEPKDRPPEDVAE